MRLHSICIISFLILSSQFSGGLISGQDNTATEKSTTDNSTTENSKTDASRKVMDHSIYEDWKSISSIQLSSDGKWAAYEVRPNKGDAVLHLVNLEDDSEKLFDRGSSPMFSPESDYLVFRIRPQYLVTRKAKLDKEKRDKMAKDSMGIYRLEQDLLSKVPRVESFKVPENSSSWFAFKHYYKKDTSSVDTNQYGKKLAKPEGRPTKLVVMNPVRHKKHEFEKVYDYLIPEKGTAVAFQQFSAIGDTIAGKSIRLFNTRKEKTEDIFTSKGTFGKFIMDRDGYQLAYMHHPDSIKKVGMNIHYWSGKGKSNGIILDSLSAGIPEDWGISSIGNFRFSGDGSKLYFGTAPKPEPEPEDSLLSEEKYMVDVWNWQDGLLQPMQKRQVNREKDRTYTAVWHTGSREMIQLADEEVESVSTMFKGNGDLALAYTSRPYNKLVSWKTHQYRDYYLINTRTGKRELILKKKEFGARLSPGGKYIGWYESSDSNYYSHNTFTGDVNCLTCNIETDFYNVEYDAPSAPSPYGTAGFTKDDKDALIYSRFDIWKIDPSGDKLPVNLTEGFGESSKTSFRYLHLEYNDPFIPLEKTIFLTAYNEETKERGIYAGSALLSRKPVSLVKGKYSYEIVKRAREADVLCWRKGDFDEYPDLYVSDPEFKNQQKISDANPQGKQYLWGSPSLVHWTSYTGEELDGILVRPDNFDPSKKYPMLIYFYEKSSDRLYRHSAPSPSRSTINFAWCASNGYVVFVPDIPYRDGYPGQSAYDAVVSGSLAMCDQFPFIDKDNVGIQGQSWGGYQVAWLLTRTNIFKAGMAGAPVSNMTSAYGGIRWGSGASRMMQYEEGQSRIGGSLWDKTDLYMENSPIFSAPDIETPLLIMHNDRDGAVPWYQGIELFVAMRRLEKPAWMLSYNNEEHNLTKWPNRVDLSIRMMQFFDHYLKDAPVPEWMDEGIPAIEKGKKDGYGLIQ